MYIDSFRMHRFSYNNLHINRDEMVYNKPCIGYVLKGKGEFLWQGKKHIASPGDLIYIAKGTRYRSFWTGSPEIEWYSISFSFARPSTLSEYKFQILKNFPAESFHNLYALYCGNTLRAISAFYLLLDKLCSKLTPTTPSEKDAVISIAVKYIENHFSEKISIEELADLCRLSQSYFFRLFKGVMGVSPIVYKNHLAIQQAIKYLSETNLSIEEISALTGFSSPNYFRRVFTAAVGKTPRELRG